MEIEMIFRNILDKNFDKIKLRELVIPTTIKLFFFYFLHLRSYKVFSNGT